MYHRMPMLMLSPHRVIMCVVLSARSLHAVHGLKLLASFKTDSLCMTRLSAHLAGSEDSIRSHQLLCAL